jgi:hypothetical protein
MTIVEPGESVLAYKDGVILAIGIVKSRGYDHSRPQAIKELEFEWSDDGWRVDVEWTELMTLVSPKDFIDEIRGLFDEKFAPLQKDGKGKQGLFLTEISKNLFHALADHIGEQIDDYMTDGLSLSRDQLVQKMREIYGQTDVDSATKQRQEQPYLRKYLFGKKKFEFCAICGHQYPVKGLMVTGHIKKRALCSDDERLDLNIVMPVCKFGCDSLYESGYIFVDQSGKVQPNPRYYVGEQGDHFINSVKGKQCRAWNPQTKLYFDYHRGRATKSKQ